MEVAATVAGAATAATDRRTVIDHNPVDLLDRVQSALSVAMTLLGEFDDRRISEMKKAGGDPVTEADLVLDRALRETLQRDSEGWLSEETADDPGRLEHEMVWIVDPLDGTREFIDGLPEFCTSIAAVVNGVPIAGGVANPAADVEIIGAVGPGLTCNGDPVPPRGPAPLRDLTVLASRSEVKRGQWQVVEADHLTVKPMGSVAYKMARVAAGLDGATWTPVPKHEWDVAGGAALLRAAGGRTVGLEGQELEFNRRDPWLDGAIAVPPGFEDNVTEVIQLVHRQNGS